MGHASAKTAADAAVTCPELHGPETTVGDLETLFRDDHVHLALIVDGGRLVAAVARVDLRPDLDPGLPARLVGSLEGRVVRGEETAADVLARMRRSGCRRLAVTGADGSLLGLLCLKANGRGFCSDEDVTSRKQDAPSVMA